MRQLQGRHYKGQDDMILSVYTSADAHSHSTESAASDAAAPQALPAGLAWSLVQGGQPCCI
eukprot:scaffold23538_cov17-Tisochrysis_lutea.AAC.1